MTPDDPVFVKLSMLTAHPEVGDLARRVERRYRLLPTEVLRPPVFPQAPGSDQLASWLAGELETSVRPLSWIKAQYQGDPQGFELVFSQNTNDLNQLYNSLLTAGSVRAPQKSLFGAALVPSVELLAGSQRKQLLHTILTD